MNRQDLEEMWQGMGGAIRANHLLFQGIMCGAWQRSTETYRDAADRPINSLKALGALREQAKQVISEFEDVRAWWLTLTGAVVQDERDSETSFWLGETWVTSWCMFGALEGASVFHNDAWEPGSPSRLKDILKEKSTLEHRLAVAKAAQAKWERIHAQRCQDAQEALLALEAAQAKVRDLEQESA